MAASEDFMVPELRREREVSKLDLPTLSNFLDGGEELTKMRKNIGMSKLLRGGFASLGCILQIR